MMYNYPFFSFPTFRGYYNNSHIINNVNSNTIANKNNINSKLKYNTNNNNLKNNNKIVKQNSKTVYQTGNNINKNNNNTEYNKKAPDILFEILGIQLHFDDILLICLIFFLYNEGVRDDYLFIVLVLLLLS